MSHLQWWPLGLVIAPAPGQFLVNFREFYNWTGTFVALITQKCVEWDTYLCTRAQSTWHEQRALRRSSSDDDYFLWKTITFMGIWAVLVDFRGIYNWIGTFVALKTPNFAPRRPHFCTRAQSTCRGRRLSLTKTSASTFTLIESPWCGRCDRSLGRAHCDTSGGTFGSAQLGWNLSSK